MYSEHVRLGGSLAYGPNSISRGLRLISVYPHGDPIISGVESVPDKPHQGERPTCGYTVRENVNGVETVKQCKSPEVAWNITGHGRYGAAKQTPVCDRHIEKVWKEWAVDSAVPINRP